MRILFDTSILVASMVQTHPKHEGAITWLKKAKTQTFSLVIASHSLVECYSVLTRLPLNPRISPIIARQLITENLKEISEIISLPSNEYFDFIQYCSNQNLSGGIVYDTLIYKTALFSRVDHVLTLNAKDFMRLAFGKEGFVLTL
jgi:predicted nucleic acid-binding protein